MDMMNKCAKFHKDSPNGKKVKFNLPRVIELSETADLMHHFVWKPYREWRRRVTTVPETVLNTSES